ncbi:MAG TPA: membrane protein [Thermomicrobiales bacterium]|nr:membrane protein [Thermomicrobiales bacterium]
MVSDTRASVPARLAMLLGGLFIFAISMALSLQCNLGASSWTVLHDGIAQQTPLSIGIVTQLVGLAMLVISWVGGIRPGFGTLANMLLIGSFLDLILWSGVIPEAESYPARIAMLLAAVVVIGLGSALYIKAGFGAGPRDSFMLVVHRRTGLRLGIARWLIEVAAVAIGILLGGDFGIGTIIFAMLVGFSIDWFFTHLGVRIATPRPATPAPADL